MSFSVNLTQKALQEEADAYLFYEKPKDGLREQFLNGVEA
jgi:hypothetical protein